MSYQEPPSTPSSSVDQPEVKDPNALSPERPQQIPHHQLSGVIEALEQSLLLTQTALRELRALKQNPPSTTPSVGIPEHHAAAPSQVSGEMGKIVEGVFNGQSMVAFDGITYPIPPNYASKSKLVEGDRLKLTILPNGAFIFKQIAPVERDRRIGALERSEHGFQARVGERVYSVLTASVTYYRGESGDQITILVPRGSESRWAAVENIIKQPRPEMSAPPPPLQVGHSVPPPPVVSDTHKDALSDAATTALDDVLSDFRP